MLKPAQDVLRQFAQACIQITANFPCQRFFDGFPAHTYLAGLFLSGGLVKHENNDGVNITKYI